MSPRTLARLALGITISAAALVASHWLWRPARPGPFVDLVQALIAWTFLLGVPVLTGTALWRGRGAPASWSAKRLSGGLLVVWLLAVLASALFLV